MKITDSIGNEIKPGMTISYPARKGNELIMKSAIVRSILRKPERDRYGRFTKGPRFEALRISPVNGSEVYRFTALDRCVVDAKPVHSNDSLENLSDTLTEDAYLAYPVRSRNRLKLERRKVRGFYFTRDQDGFTLEAYLEPDEFNMKSVMSELERCVVAKKLKYSYATI